MVPRRRWFDKIESVNLPTRIEVFPGHGDGLPVQGYIDSSSYERVPRVCSRRYGGSGVSICIHESSLPYPLARDNAQAQARVTRAKLLELSGKVYCRPSPVAQCWAALSTEYRRDAPDNAMFIEPYCILAVPQRARNDHWTPERLTVGSSVPLRGFSCVVKPRALKTSKR